MYCPWLWGLTKNRLNELSNSEKSWGAILLVGSPETGYFIESEKKIMDLINSGEIRLAGDGDFKINVNRITNLGQKLMDIDAFESAIFKTIRK